MIAKIDSVIVVVVAKIEVRHTMVDDLNLATCVMRTKLKQEFVIQVGQLNWEYVFIMQHKL